MTSRERVLTALRGGIPDRVPIWEYLFSLKLQKEVMGYNTELHDDIPLENAMSLIETVHKFGKYPLIIE